MYDEVGGDDGGVDGEQVIDLILIAYSPQGSDTAY